MVYGVGCTLVIYDQYVSPLSHFMILNRHVAPLVLCNGEITRINKRLSRTNPICLETIETSQGPRATPRPSPPPERHRYAQSSCPPGAHARFLSFPRPKASYPPIPKHTISLIQSLVWIQSTLVDFTGTGHVGIHRHLSEIQRSSVLLRPYEVLFFPVSLLPDVQNHPASQNRINDALHTNEEVSGKGFLIKPTRCLLRTLPAWFCRHPRK